MAGKPGRSGGARPNSGRPSKLDVEYQASMRELIREVVSVEDWKKVLAVRLSFALAGNGDAFKDLEKWVMGRVPEETKAEVSVAIGPAIYLPKRKPIEP